MLAKLAQIVCVNGFVLTCKRAVADGKITVLLSSRKDPRGHAIYKSLSLSSDDKFLSLKLGPQTPRTLHSVNSLLSMITCKVRNFGYQVPTYRYHA